MFPFASPCRLSTLFYLDGSGTPDFVVGINDGAFQVLTNNAFDIPLRVRLLGAKGNPTAVNQPTPSDKDPLKISRGQETMPTARDQ